MTSASAVLSRVPDLRNVPLGAPLPVSLDQAVQRVVPGTLPAPVPVAAFSSAI